MTCPYCKLPVIRKGGHSHCNQAQKRMRKAESDKKLGRYVGEMLFNLLWRVPQ
jgi:uncharacterized Zn finger protein (UPF0148 family)